MTADLDPLLIAALEAGVPPLMALEAAASVRMSRGDVGTYSLDPPPEFLSPDCRGKGCAACNGDAWDEGGPGRPEGLTTCTHHCHRKDTL